MQKLLLVIVTCLLWSGCTKNEEASAQQPARQNGAAETKPAPDRRKVIAVLGDSLAEGYGVETGKSFPDQLQAKLNDKKAGYRVVNLGISGDTTTGGLGRVQSVVDLKPAIVILELGGNDGLRGVPIASTRANLEQMIRVFQKTGANVLLAGMTLPPNYGRDYINRFETAYKDLAREYHLHLIPFLMEDIRTQIATNRDLMQADGIHPTAAGHAVVANTVLHYLEPML